MTTPSRMTRPDPDANTKNLFRNPLLGPSLYNSVVRVAATFFITRSAEERGWDFTPENYGLDKLKIPQFPGVNGQSTTAQASPAALDDTGTGAENDVSEVSFDSRLQCIGDYTKEVFSQYPTATLAATVTALTGMYAVLLGPRMPHAKTRMPVAFLLAAATTYGIANYAFACSLPQPVVNATVNAVVSNIIITGAAHPIRFIAGVLQKWPGHSSSVNRKEV